MLRTLIHFFSFGKLQIHPLFESNLQYANPASGEEAEDSLDELRERAVIDTFELFSRVESYLDTSERDCTGEESVEFLRERDGKSLDSGLLGVGVEQMQIYAKNRFTK